MAGISVVTDTTTEPLTTAYVRDYLRVDDTIDNTIIDNLIKSARIMVENHTGRTLCNKTLKLSVDFVNELDHDLWEGMRVAPDLALKQNYITLPQSPVSSVTHVKYYDDSDNATTYASTKYYLDSVRIPARVVLRNGEQWPTGLRVANGIEITYVAGFGTNATDIPEAMRLAVSQIVAYLYENRGDMDGGQVPPSVMPLLQPYRILGIGSTFNELRGGY